MRKRLDIKKDEIIRYYVDKDMTTYEIAKLLGCHRCSVSRLLKRCGVNIKRHKRAYSFYYEQKLNPEQKELLIGSLIGDGCVSKHHNGINSCRFIETHSIAQLDYLMWKKDILQNFVSSNIQFIDNSKNKSYSNGISACFYTVLHKEFVYFYELFYKDGKKQIPDNIKLSPLSLAVWFFDDGSVSKNGKNSWFATFHVEGFSEHDIDVLRKMLKSTFGIDSFIVKVKNGKYNIIRLNNKEYKKLCEIISPFGMNCMNYKIKFFDNPVETYPILGGVPVLKCSGANTHSSSPS